MKIKENLLSVIHGLKLYLLPCDENNQRAKIFSGNFLIVFLIAIAVLKLGYGIFLYSFSNNQFYADITKTALVDLANRERAKQNLPPLSQNPLLDQAAYLKAQDMAQNGYFNHVSPTGVSPWHWFGLSGYNYRYAGENLAIGFVDSQEVQNAWVASPSHKANIVNGKYKEIGIAVLKTAFQGNPATIVVQMFGAKSAKQNNAPLAAITGQSATGTDQMAKSAVLGAAVAAPETGSFGFRTMQFFSGPFFNIIQFLIYGALILVIGLLILNFILKADLAHADLLAKAAGFLAVMAIFALMDQGLIAAMVPRNLPL